MRLAPFSIVLAILAVAQSPRTIERRPDEPVKTSGRAKALVIGVDQYESEGILDLQFADDDARAIRNVLIASGEYRPEDIVLMIPANGPPRSGPDMRPTRANIVRELLNIREAANGLASVLFYFSGHGGGGRDQNGRPANLLFPSDTVIGGEEEMGIDVEGLLGRLGQINVNRRIVILDACRKTFAKDAKGPGAPWRTPEVLPDQGTMLLLSTQFDTYSYEDEQQGYGVFTAALLRGLRGDADGYTKEAPNNGIVEAEELEQFLRDEMRKSQHDGAPQSPMLIPYYARSEEGFPVLAVARDLGAHDIPERRGSASDQVSLVLQEQAVGGRPQWKNDLGYVMVQVEPGAFWMGADSADDGENPTRAGEDDEGPRHRVELTSAFLLGSTEVTQRQWRAIAATDPSLAELDGLNMRGDDLPMQGLTWYEAIRFANALSEHDGLEPAYRIKGNTISWDTSSPGYRLPTEAEWEYAARARSDLNWPGTNETADLCAFANLADRTYLSRFPKETGSVECSDGFIGLAPVGRLRPNGWGFHDMSGNVFEWVWDRYGPYSKATGRDPKGASRGNLRVVRGGSMGVHADLARLTYRAEAEPSFRAATIGFRVARTIPTDQD